MREFRTAYGPPHRVAFECDPVSLAKQSMADECNINNIMAKYQKTGLLDHVNKYSGEYGEAIGHQDYHESMNQVLAAQAAFESLPSGLRSRFQNSPEAFINFVDDPDNIPELIEMGLLEAPPEPVEAPPDRSEFDVPLDPPEDPPEDKAKPKGKA